MFDNDSMRRFCDLEYTNNCEDGMTAQVKNYLIPTNRFTESRSFYRCHYID